MCGDCRIMRLKTGYINEFVAQQHMDKNDKAMQLNCIREEVDELRHASVFCENEELKEICDVLITILVYAKMCSISETEIEDEFSRKMKINLEKPVREEGGMKVKKK